MGLIDELAIETAYKENKPEFEPEKLEKTDFDLPAEEKKPPVATPTPGTTPAPEARTATYYLKAAQRWVKAFSAVLSFSAKRLYPSAILRAGDQEKFNQVQDEIKSRPGESEESVFAEIVRNDSSLLGACKRVTFVQELIDGAPLTRDEIQSIAEPLSEVIEKHRYLNLGPEGALALAVVLVMLPRIEPLFPNLSKVIDGQFQAGKNDGTEAAAA